MSSNSSKSTIIDISISNKHGKQDKQSDSQQKNSSEGKRIGDQVPTKARYFYEQLGAPTILYQHFQKKCAGAGAGAGRHSHDSDNHTHDYFLHDMNSDDDTDEINVDDDTDDHTFDLSQDNTGKRAGSYDGKSSDVEGCQDDDPKYKAMEYLPTVEKSYHTLQPWKNMTGSNTSSDLELQNVNTLQMRRYATRIVESTQNANRARLMHYFHDTLGRAIWSGSGGFNPQLNEFDTKSQYFATRVRVPAPLTVNGSDDTNTSIDAIDEEMDGDGDDKDLNIGVDFDVDADADADAEMNENKKSRKYIATRTDESIARIKMRYSVQRMHATPRAGYCAPFRLRDVESCLMVPEKSDKKMPVGQDMPILQNNPMYYGNCLELLPCPCHACLGGQHRCAHQDDEFFHSSDERRVEQRNHFANQFLLYPKGQSLCISSICLPQLQSPCNDAGQKMFIPKRKHVQIDVGGRVMQVETCFDASDPQTIPSQLLSIVRTPKDCVVISCHAQQHDEDNSGTVSNKSKLQSNAMNSSCTGRYKLRRIANLELCDSEDNVLEPIYLTAKKHNSTFYGGQGPIFATVSKSAKESVLGKNGPTTIHYMTCNINNLASINTERHQIENLSSISQIKFSETHPMVLWSAARCKSEQILFKGKGYTKRPAIGYGHSLHSIDLRSDKASFVWSPSDDEFVCKGIHSISGILTDKEKPHSVYVSSPSAEGKVYHVDARMPSRTLCTWTLPGMCNEGHSVNSPSGLYGSGTILTRPYRSPQQRDMFDLPVIGISKEPSSSGFHLYQSPEKMGNFQTRVLEQVPLNGLDPMRNIATSSFFPLPKISKKVFTTGIVSFYTPASSILRNIEALKYDRSPDLALCIISANSHGDLYSYTALACHQGQEPKTKVVDGGPLGSCAIPIPIIERKRQRSSSSGGKYHQLQWFLSNTYPSPSDRITRSTDIPTSQYCKLAPAKTFDNQIETNTSKPIELYHQMPDKNIGSFSMEAPLRRPAMTFFPRNRIRMNSSRKQKRYPLKQPSENLRGIIAKLRSRERK